MSKQLKHWESGRAEIRKVPIVCSICGKEVQVGGWVHEDKLVFENCPGCDAPIRAEFYSGIEGDSEDVEKKYPISAEITWKIEGGMESERTSSFGPVIQVLSLLMSVLQSGIRYFAHPKLSEEHLFYSIATIIATQILTFEQVEALMAICVQQQVDSASEKPSITLVTDPGNGEVVSPDKDTDKETKDDDE